MKTGQKEKLKKCLEEFARDIWRMPINEFYISSFFKWKGYEKTKLNRKTFKKIDNLIKDICIILNIEE